MQKRKFDELVSYFNKKVSEMEIETKYKMELLGMVTALGCAHEKEMSDLSETKRDSSDLISRQAAIDAVLDMNAEHRVSWKDAVIDIINELPSERPEIIHCRECKYGVDYYHDGDCYCSNPKWGLKYFGGSWDFYCADAKIGNSGKGPAQED